MAKFHYFVAILLILQTFFDAELFYASLRQGGGKIEDFDGGSSLFNKTNISTNQNLNVKLGFICELKKLVYENEELPQSTSLTAPCRREP